MVFVWITQLVSPFCQYSLFVVTVRVTLQPVRAIVSPAANTVNKTNFFMMMLFLGQLLKTIKIYFSM